MSAPPKKTAQGDRISVAAMRKALVRSGYLLEQRVEALLDEHGYYVETNRAYPDETTGKSRELDIWAMAAHVHDADRADAVFWILLCECENNLQPVVFFTKGTALGFLHHHEVKMSGLPVKIVGEDGEFQRLSEFLTMGNYHHYCGDWISTQYCSFHRQRGLGEQEWIASHHEEQHDSLDALAAAVEASIDDNYKHWEVSDDESVNLQFHYPVLVLQGPLYEAYVEDSRLFLRQTDHVLYRKEYHSAKRHETYQIDIVRESYLPRFLDIVDTEMRKTGRLVRRRRDAMRKSIAGVVALAKSRAEASPLRKAFEL